MRVAGRDTSDLWVVFWGNDVAEGDRGVGAGSSGIVGLDVARVVGCCHSIEMRSSDRVFVVGGQAEESKISSPR